MTPTVVVRHIDTLLTMDPSLGEAGWGRIRDGAVAFEGDRVVWVGADREAPDAPEVVDGRGCVALPGLVDCHTHTVWAGSRAVEFERRLAGAAYTDILKEGGGILSTVRATRAAPEDELVIVATARLAAMAARGVSAVEIKSGYGLSAEAEAKCLRAARRAGELAGVRVFTTFLGAHAIPAEHRPNRAGYLDEIEHQQLPAVAGLADFVDVYVDDGAFTVDEGERVLRAGIRHGLKPRIHAEQVGFTGSAKMAAGLGALSADHLERVDDDGIAAMAAAGTIGVMLPGAMVYLRDICPPVAKLREAGVPLAVATDFNPGSSPVGDLWACASLACVAMRLTVEEALRGVTCVAADALGAPELGRLRPGSAADLTLVRPPPGEPAEPAVLVQYLGAPRVVARFVRGVRG